MNSENFVFTCHDTSFFGTYRKANEAKATIVLVHGMGSHSGRYEDSVIPILLQNRFNVVSFDHFGHGKTGGKRGHNPGYKYVLQSVELTICKAKERFPNLPVFLYGHSMGGNVVINFSLKSTIKIDGVIATSPMLKLAMQPPAWKLLLGEIANKVAPSITLDSKLNPKHISRDESQISKYKDDPLVHSKISSNYSTVFFKMGKWALEHSDRLKMPMLLLHGTGDLICDYKASEQFAKGNTLVQLKLYEGGYHELHHDLCAKEMLNDVIYWLQNQNLKK